MGSDTESHCYCQKITCKLLDRDIWLRILIGIFLNSTKAEKNKRKFFPNKGLSFPGWYGQGNHHRIFPIFLAYVLISSLVGHKYSFAAQVTLELILFDLLNSQPQMVKGLLFCFKEAAKKSTLWHAKGCLKIMWHNWSFFIFQDSYGRSSLNAFLLTFQFRCDSKTF